MCFFSVCNKDGVKEGDDDDAVDQIQVQSSPAQLFSWLADCVCVVCILPLSIAPVRSVFGLVLCACGQMQRRFVEKVKGMRLWI